MTQPPPGPSETAPPRYPLKPCLIAAAFWLTGMLLAHGPLIRSGLGRVQGDLGDPRYLHYILEHGYRWLTGDPAHRSFWDPPIFYPAQNTAAYSETLFGAAPIYWLWRALGTPWDLAYPLWILTVSSLNFLAAHLFFRRVLERSAFAAGFGAFLFSFASIRLAHIGHSQLLPAFWYVFTIYGLTRALQQPDLRKATPWLGLFAASFAAQLYTCFYIGWFLALALGIALLAACSTSTLRADVIPRLKRVGPGIALAGIAAGLSLIPLIRHSLQAAADVGYRDYDEAEVYLPRIQSWFFFGTEHWLYGGLAGLWPFTLTPTRAFEHVLGLGFVTPVLAALGLWSLRRTPWGRILIAITLTLLLLTLILPGGASLWALTYLVIPGAKAIRAVARVGLVLLLPISVGAAYFLDSGRWRKPALIASALLALLEQGRAGSTYDRREQRDAAAGIAGRVDPACEAFWYSRVPGSASSSLLDSMPYRYQVDAMWAGMVAGKPTVNGYSGWSPPGWTFEGSALSTDEAQIDQDLGEWCRKKGLDRRKIQLIRDTR